MIKRLIKILLILIIIITIIIAYLSSFGISTQSFNNKIKSEILNINKSVTLEIKSVKLLLDPLNLSINIKTFSPEVFINNSKLELDFIKTNISLKSFINKEFSIDDLQISTKTIMVKDLVLLARSFKNSPELFILNNIIKGGTLVGDIRLNFDSNGKIKDNYEIKGFVNKGKLDILRKYSINDLNFIFNIKDKEYHLKKVKSDFNEIRLSSESIKIKEENNHFLINGKLISKKDDIDIETLKKITGYDLKEFDINNISLKSNNNFSFSLNKKLKVQNFELKSIINLDKLVYKNNLLNIKDYLPYFKELIKLEDHEILIDYKKNKINIEGKGKIRIDDKIESIDYKIDEKNGQYNFDTNIKISKNQLLINALQYKKKGDIDSILKLKGFYKKNNQIKFSLISFNENDNTFLIKDLNLNNEFKILDINKIVLNYINNSEIKNNINIKKDKQIYKIKGKSFDLTKIINSILNSDNEESLIIFDNIDTRLNIEIDQTYLDNQAFVKDLKGSIDFKDNKISKLMLDSTFLNSKKLNLTVNTNKKNEKITTLSSSYPKPLVGQYKFIKGFEGGVLDFYSIKKKGASNSILTIENFRIQEVPVLAKLLTLASLQGIADLLTGEGIRFSNFEMKFSNKKKLMTIEELFAIGPAISILMDGYIDSKKMISLRGTLVPATTINKSISSIPIIGKILVGEKTGEGVFGVSFKIKGPPNSLKTSVNPVKTLTPRFITRTLEKIKKN